MPRHSAATRLATDILDFRRFRGDIISRDIFAEPAWDLLLRLYVAQANGNRLTAEDAKGSADVPSNVMIRWMKHLANLGYIRGFEPDRPDSRLELAEVALKKIELVLEKGLSMQNFAE